MLVVIQLQLLVEQNTFPTTMLMLLKLLVLDLWFSSSAKFCQLVSW